MAWPEKRRSKDGSIHWRIRDRVNGKIVTVIKNAGRWEKLAQIRQLEYEKDLAGNGSALLPKRPLGIEEMCDLNLRLHAPNLTDGLSNHYNSSYYNLRLRMNRLKEAWQGKYAHEINSLTVRDFLAQFHTVGNRLRWLGVIGKMFRNFEEWSDEGHILSAAYQLPEKNPAYQWRHQMKRSEKREEPDQRVLTPEEWKRFSSHLNKRALAICEIALYRCLRKADIRKISHLSITEGYIKGLQSKTGEPYKVPVMPNHPARYNFKDFELEFERAQVAAGLNYPANHPIHFSMKDLRRTGATWAYQETKDIVAVQKLLGHRSLATTQRYLRIDTADLQKAVAAIHKRALSRGAPVEQKGIYQAKGA